MARKIKDGIETTWTNSTGGNVVAGKVVAMGKMAGVTAEAIANGSSGKVFITGVFQEDKKTATDVIAQGDVLKENSGIEVLQSTVTGGETIQSLIIVGRALEASSSAVSTVVFKLGL